MSCGRIAEIAEADAIGGPSLLRDGLPERDHIAIETYRDVRAAMLLIREAVEDCAPPGSVTRESYLTPVFTVQAVALVPSTRLPDDAIAPRDGTNIGVRRFVRDHACRFCRALQRPR